MNNYYTLSAIYIASVLNLQDQGEFLLLLGLFYLGFALYKDYER